MRLENTQKTRHERRSAPNVEVPPRRLIEPLVEPLVHYQGGRWTVRGTDKFQLPASLMTTLQNLRLEQYPGATDAILDLPRQISTRTPANKQRDYDLWLTSLVGDQVTYVFDGQLFSGVFYQEEVDGKPFNYVIDCDVAHPNKVEIRIELEDFHAPEPPVFQRYREYMQ